MHTIVLATQKGGSGKSTLAIGLALAAMQDGHVVRLIETDPQGTISNWRRRRSSAEPLVEAINDTGAIGPRLQMFDRDGVSLTIIDTAGSVNALTAAAIHAADLCLIPARPSPADIEATAPTLGVVRSCRKPFAFILNQTLHRGRRIHEAAATLGDGAARPLGHSRPALHRHAQRSPGRTRRRPGGVRICNRQECRRKRSATSDTGSRTDWLEPPGNGAAYMSSPASGRQRYFRHRRNRPQSAANLRATARAPSRPPPQFRAEGAHRRIA
jgi:hypothetical protein